MIAVEHPQAISLPTSRAASRVSKTRSSLQGLKSRLSAAVVVVAILSSLGSAGLADAGSAFILQSRATAIHAHWQVMRAEGIPDADLAELEQEWTTSQQSKIMGVASFLWLPGAKAALDRWQAAAAGIWARDLGHFRNRAVAADLSLHRALGTEPFVQQKARVEALAAGTTPGDFAALTIGWELEAKLVPIDRRIAASAGLLLAEIGQAKALGIRSEPAPDSLAGAGVYSNLGPEDRMARSRVLTRGLQAVQQELQGRLDAASATLQAINHAEAEVSAATLYGIDLPAAGARLTSAHAEYASALSATEFNSITTDVNQVASTADSAIAVTLSQTHIVSGVSFYYQDKPLSCEEASTSMALTHQGIYLSQDQILAEVGADLNPMYVDGQGRVRWGNPYETFVGNVNGSESNYTGFGTYYPPLVRVAQAHGAKILAYGSMSAGSVYARVIAGHPVVAFSTWDWQWHPRRDYLSFDGQWIPWIGPYYASHVYVVVGVSPSQVLINDPIRGQYWISRGAFEAGYSDFNEAIVFA